MAFLMSARPGARVDCLDAEGTWLAAELALLNLARRTGAIQIAKKIRARWRYIESDRNTADRPSRVPIRKGLEHMIS